MQVPRVLFVSERNACRSQMAEAFAWRASGDRIVVASAGIKALDALDPLAVWVMRECGMDMTHHYPKSLTKFLRDPFDFVIVLGASRNVESELPPSRVSATWLFSDPSLTAGPQLQRVVTYRKMREEIAVRVRLFLLANHLVGPTHDPGRAQHAF